MTLLNMIRKEDILRKIFGKRELKIIEKQLLGVSLTQSEKNRLSRDIRKKLEAIELLSRFKQDFKLKKGAEITKIINETKEVMLSDMLTDRIQSIYLYGSKVDNNLSLNSDIDLAVSIKDTDIKESTSFRKRILGKVDERIDVQVLETLPEKLRKEIKTRGKILFSR